MSANGGLGAVIQKNVQLHNYKSADGLTAIKAWQWKRLVDY
jgi:hypothetical protein